MSRGGCSQPGSSCYLPGLRALASFNVLLALAIRALAVSLISLGGLGSRFFANTDPWRSIGGLAGEVCSQEEYIGINKLESSACFFGT
eukprot:gene13042-biopygen3541